ncbi:ATP-dependent helicase, partial [Proteus mirabilis]
EIMIFDEAHQIPDIASHYFGQQLTSRQLFDLARDMIVAYRTEVRDQVQLQKSADRLTQMVQDFRLSLGDTGFRGNLRELLQNKETKRYLTLLDDALELSYDVMKLSLGRSQLLDSAFERATLYRNRLKRLIDTTIAGYSYWFESYGRHFLLAITPLSVADKFRELIKSHKSSWIFTSATLSVDEKMSYYTDRLGLENAT